MRAIVDSSVSSTVTATLTDNSGGSGSGGTADDGRDDSDECSLPPCRRLLNDYTVSIEVKKETPTGSYNVTLETYMSRNSEDTSIYNDTITLTVTEPAATTTNSTSDTTSTTDTANTT